MPFDRKEYMRQYRLNNKEKIKEYDKKYRENNKDKIKINNEKYRLNNQEKIKEYFKTENGRKSTRISDWKRRGVIGDYEELYNIFLSTNNCNLCNCELDKCGSSRKCLDHDHSTGLFRNILCHRCNTKFK
tara:strand:- start:1518 stop:1907 length:390 start_codon:yes stop_codon:yes gene_type:complete